MGPRQWGCISFLLLQMLPSLTSIRITDAPPTSAAADIHADESAAINYRVSAPKPKKSSNRVPSHQQGIRTGYVDDDADDVIHIIEPPQYFELLKMLAQKRLLPTERTKQQQQQLTIDAPKKIPFRDQTHQSSEVAAIKMPPKYMKKPVFRPPNGLPFELLASVRQRERLVHNAPRPVAMPLARERIKTQKLQTVLMEQGYAQKQFERGQQLQLGALRSGSGQVRRKQRVRRDVENLVGTKRQDQKSAKAPSLFKSRKTKKSNKSRTPVKPGMKRYKSRSPGTVARKRLEAKNKSAKLLKARKTRVTTSKRRPKREVQQYLIPKEELYQKNVLIKGNELLDHLTALLKQATYYLPDSPQAESAADNKAKTTTKKEAPKNMLVQMWQHETRPAELIGEIEPTPHTTETEVKPSELLKEEQVKTIAANSWNVTNAIMENLIKQKTSTVDEDASQRNAHDECSQSNESDAMEKLQQRIDCMRQQLLREATNSTAMRLRKRFGERIREKKISASLVVNTKPPNRKIRKQRKHKQQQQQGSSYFNYRSSSAASKTQAPTIDNLSLLYEDVMTNIRNLLQAKNLEELEDELEQRNLKRKQQQAVEDTSSPRFAAPRQLIEDASDSEDFGEFNHLNKYLNELQQIVSDFVHPVRSSSETSTTELNLNMHEYAGSSTITPLLSTKPVRADDWYLINDEGRIYQTHLAAELRPSIAVFHRFPDIPNAPFYLKNRTHLPEQSTDAVEIL